MKNLIFPLLIAWICTFPLQAQMFNMDVNGTDALSVPSPGISYQDIGLQEATGKMQISIPLFVISQDGFTHPVSLSYNSGGLRVDESASRVGLGWNLQAGGSITRIVCGYPDEDPIKGCLNPNIQSTLNGESNGVMTDLYNGVYDGETDYYVFQAGGLSGKFFYKNGYYYSMPHNGQIIEKGNFLSHENAFRITDENGVIYYFTENEKTSLSDNDKISFLYTDRINTWLLTKIVLPNQSQLLFNYGPEKEFWVKGGLLERAKHLKKPSFCSTAITNSTYTRKEIWYYYKTRLLENIEYDFGKLEFQYAVSPREDIPGDFALQSLFLRNSQNAIVSRFNFDYYYKSRLNVFHGSSASKRMMLGSLTEVVNENGSLPPYLFDYNDKDPNSCLPAPGTASQDKFGYFNGENVVLAFTDNKATLLPSYTYTFQNDPQSSSHITEVIDGAQRNIHPFFMQAMVLKKIFFPTGAIQEFEYESNKYLNESGTAEETGPGLRLKKLITDDGNGNKLYKNYSYENGISTDFKTFPAREVNAFAWCNISGTQINSAQNIAILLSSSPRNLIPGLFAAPVYYGKVSWEETDALGNNLNGKTENLYYAEKLSGILEYRDGTPPNTLSDTKVLLARPYFYGSLLKSSVYANEGNTYRLILETSYEYNLNEMPWQTVNALYPRPLNTAANQFLLKFLGYIPRDGFHKAIYSSQIFHLTKITKKEWGTSGNEFNNTLTEFNYEPVATAQHFKPVSVYNTYSDGTVLSKHFTRVSDYSISIPNDEASQAIYQMNLSNQKGTCIEWVGYRNKGSAGEKILEGKVNEFKVLSPSNPQVVLLKEYDLKRIGNAAGFVLSGIVSGLFQKDSHYFLSGQSLSFNGRGQSICHQNRESISAQIMNPGNEFVLATASNASQSEIAYCGFENLEISSTSPLNIPVSSGNLYVQSGGAVFISEGFAGSKSLQLNSNCSLQSTNLMQLNPNKKYLLTLWCKYGNPDIRVNGTAQATEVLQINNGWTLIQCEFPGAGNVIINGTCLIDEVKLKPIDAEMNSMVYNLLNQKVAESDNNNNYIFYQYDSLNRIYRVYDMDQNLIKQTTYQIQENQN